MRVGFYFVGIHPYFLKEHFIIQMLFETTLNCVCGFTDCSVTLTVTEPCPCTNPHCPAWFFVAVITFWQVGQTVTI
jgi:hypothetical protein